jgi:type VI secretion system Hcp family effector
MAFDAFLKIDGINGESRGGEIPLESFSWGVSNSRSSATRDPDERHSKASFQDFSFAAVVGKQSPQLFEAVAEGKPIGSATLTVTGTGNTGKIEDLLTIKFMDVFIASYKLDEGAATGVQLGAPMESVSFNFAKVEFQSGGKFGAANVGH